MNCPSPFNLENGETRITFYIGADADDLSIYIYTLSGRLLRTITGISVGFGYKEAGWAGRDGGGNGLANGVYVYKVVATKGQKKAESTGKAIIVH